MLILCFLYVNFHKGVPTFVVGFLCGRGGGVRGGMENGEMLMSEWDDA